MNEHFCLVRDFAKSLKPKTNKGFFKTPKTEKKEKKTNLAKQNERKIRTFHVFLTKDSLFRYSL